MQAGFSGILLVPPFTGNDFSAQIGFASQPLRGWVTSDGLVIPLEGRYDSREMIKVDLV